MEKNQLGKKYDYKSSEKNVVCEKDVLCLRYKGNEAQERQKFYITLNFLIHCMRNRSVKWGIKKKKKKKEIILHCHSIKSWCIIREKAQDINLMAKEDNNAMKVCRHMCEC